jgi:hypothetical protein
MSASPKRARQTSTVPPDEVGDQPKCAHTVTELVESGDLSQRHYDALKARAISDEIILERGYCTWRGPVQVETAQKELSKGQKDPKRFPVLAIPAFQCGANKPHAYIMRPDNPRTLNPKSAAPKIVKYEYPKGAGQVLDALPGRKAALGDPSIPMWVPEGILKADAITSAGGFAAAINGVYGWRGTNDKGGKLIIPDLEEVAWNKRHVILAFDSDMSRNADVMMAARRFGAWVEAKRARVGVLMLPQDGDKKVGVDDFLASLPPEQRTIETLMRYVVPLVEGTKTFTDRFGKTAEGRELLNPPGFQNRQGPLTYTHPQTGITKTIYNGYIAVTARGHDAETHEATLTVSWRDGEISEGAVTRTVTAPQAELATGRGVINVLAARGATVYERNAKELSEFLLEFARLNAAAIPYKIVSNHYGYSGDGIVGPGWSVGTNTSYNGHAPIKIKTSGADEYLATLHEASLWGAAPLMLALGLAVASPYLERLNTVRNPIMWLSGDSNHGKTSIAEFAVALYGDPQGLSIQAGRTTWAGFTQRLQYLRGFPMLVDEAHTADPTRLQNVIYQHANGQTYAKGGMDGQPLGSDLLSGAVFVSGEAPPQLTFKGARNRVLDIRAAKHLPLGIGPNDVPQGGLPSGRERADTLKKAVDLGAGSLGERVTRAIWDDWDTFADRVATNEAAAASSATTGHEWLRPLAAAAAGLYQLFKVCDVPLERYPKNIMGWAHEALCASRADNDPAREAFEALRALILNANDDIHHPDVLSVRNERVAHINGNEWYILQNSEPVKKALEPYGGLQGLASQWTQRGWIVPGSDGKSTARRAVQGARQRVLVVREAVMRDGTEAEGGSVNAF